MYNGIEFLSVFKIEEKSILRPCLSDSKREEIRRFKAKALEIERRLAKKNKNSTINGTDDTINGTEIEAINVVDIENCSVNSENHTDNDVDNDNFITSISEWDISSIPGTDHENRTVSVCSGVTETIDYSENVNDTAGQSNNTFVPSSIIRSDSFIVDEPSECFLKQLEDNGVVPSNSTSHTDVSIKTELNQTKIFVKQTEKRKPDVKKMTNPKIKKYPPKPFVIKKGRITSDNISNLPDKLIRKCQTTNVSDLRKDRQDKFKQIASINQARKPMSQVESSFTQTDINQEYSNETAYIDDRIAAIIADVEDKFHNEIMFFLEKQKREQDAFLRKLMSQVNVKQDAFQSNLITQIKAMISDGASKFLNNQANFPGLNNSTNMLNDVNGNLSVIEIGETDYVQNETFKAATKINAFVRGYLTRRLFKTDHVQQIVKTIRDSLYLVIDLHFEKNDVESVADIQMKHNLLQQLESSRYNLSHIFTTKPTAEQMAMISLDRNMMINRLVQSNSKNNNIYEDQPLYVHQRPSSATVENKNVNKRSSSISVEDKLKNLTIIKLFSDSISSEEAKNCSYEFEDT